MARPYAKPHVAGILTAALVTFLALVTGCPFKEETYVMHCNVDTDCHDGNECTDDHCTDTVCDNPVSMAHASCSTGVCDGMGTCVTCIDRQDDSVCATLHGDNAGVCDSMSATCVEC